MVVGKVGSGKSSLLGGLINEVPVAAGQVQVCGQVAYCSPPSRRDAALSLACRRAA